jgi:hypothetical protein
LVFGDSIELWDAQTGDKKIEIWNPRRFSGIYGSMYWPAMSKDRRLVWSNVDRIGPAGWWDEWGARWMPWMFPSAIAFVADVSNGSMLLQVPVGPNGSDHRWLSDDGCSLFVSESDTTGGRVYDHRAYDIPARPRWAWIVGVPAGLGGLVLSWRRWRQPRQSAATKT